MPSNLPSKARFPLLDEPSAALPSAALFDERLRAPLQAAIEGVVDLRALVQGRLVAVKPNLFMPRRAAVTDVRVLSALMQLLLDAGADRVRVLESVSISTRLGRRLTSGEVFEQLGLERMVAERPAWTGRVELVPLAADQQAYDLYPTRPGLHLRQVDLARRLGQDEPVVISLAPLKIHRQTMITGCLKNWWGLTSEETRLANHCEHLEASIVDVVSARPPDLAILEAMEVMEWDHSAGPLVPFNLLLASRDPVALDAVGAYLVGFEDPCAVPTIALGARAGLGTADLEAMEFVGLDRAAIERRRQSLRRMSFAKEGSFRVEDLYRLSPHGNLFTPPTEFPLHLYFGKMPGQGCTAYLLTGLETLLQAPDLAARCRGGLHILLGQDPPLPDPETLQGTVLILGSCPQASPEVDAFRNRCFLRGILVSQFPWCPPMAMRTTWFQSFRAALEAAASS